jgi:hypothetical protein
MTAVDGEPRSEDETQHGGKVSAQLARQLGGIVRHVCGRGEVAAPNPVQHDLKVDEDQFPFFALLDAAALDCAQLFMRPVELARPGQYQRVHHTGFEHSRSEGFLVLHCEGPQQV